MYEIRRLKDWGLISNYWDYMDLPPHVREDVLMVVEAEARRAGHEGAR